MDFSLVITCYNEVALLEDSVNKIIRVLQETPLKWEIIFIDDHSIDGTREVIELIRKNNNDLIFKTQFHQENKGRGKSVDDGIRLAEGDIVGFIDIDLEVPPHYLFPLIQKIKEDNFDVIVAKRIYQLGSGAILRFMTGLCWKNLVKIFLKLPIIDVNSGYKLFRRDKILCVLEKVKDERWFWDTEIIARAYLANLKIGEMPAVFTRRTDKKSAIRLLQDSVEYFTKLLKFRAEYKEELKIKYDNQ